MSPSAMSLATITSRDVFQIQERLPAELNLMIMKELLYVPSGISLDTDPIDAKTADVMRDFTNTRRVCRAFHAAADESVSANRFTLDDDPLEWARGRQHSGWNTIDDLPAAVKGRVKILAWSLPSLPNPDWTFSMWFGGTFLDLAEKIGEFVNLKCCEIRWDQADPTNDNYTRALSEGAENCGIRGYHIRHLPHGCTLSIPGIPKHRELSFAAYVHRFGVGACGMDDFKSRLEAITSLTHLDSIRAPVQPEEVESEGYDEELGNWNGTGGFRDGDEEQEDKS